MDYSREYSANVFPCRVTNLVLMSCPMRFKSQMRAPRRKQPYLVNACSGVILLPFLRAFRMLAFWVVLFIRSFQESIVTRPFRMLMHGSVAVVANGKPRWDIVQVLCALLFMVNLRCFCQKANSADRMLH